MTTLEEKRKEFMAYCFNETNLTGVDAKKVWGRFESYVKELEGEMKVTGETSDGYHTFNELYEHRHLLFLNLMMLKANLNHGDVWKSKKHDDGTMYDGWFIAGMDSKSQPISYHLPIKYWDLCAGIELEKAPKWDGYTPNDVLKRLKDQLEYYYSG